MKTDDLITEIKNSILELIKVKYGEQSKAIENEINEFLTQTNGNFVRWTQLLEKKQLSKEEFELLMLSQKDLFVMKTLYKKGVSKISLGHFKNKVINIILASVFKLIL